MKKLVLILIMVLQSYVLLCVLGLLQLILRLMPGTTVVTMANANLLFVTLLALDFIGVNYLIWIKGQTLNF